VLRVGRGCLADGQPSQVVLHELGAVAVARGRAIGARLDECTHLVGHQYLGRVSPVLVGWRSRSSPRRGERCRLPGLVVSLDVSLTLFCSAWPDPAIG